MKSLLISLLVVFTIPRLCAEEKEQEPSEPKQEIVKLEELPPGIVQILHKLKTMEKEQSPEGVLRHLGLDKDKRVTEMDSGGELGSCWIGYDLGIDGQWVLILSGTLSEAGDQLVFPPKIYTVTLQKGSIRDFHEKGGDVDWQVILPYWKNGEMASKLHYHGSDTILVQLKKEPNKAEMATPSKPSD